MSAVFYIDIYTVLHKFSDKYLILRERKRERREGLKRSPQEYHIPSKFFQCSIYYFSISQQQYISVVYYILSNNISFFYFGLFNDYLRHNGHIQNSVYIWITINIRSSYKITVWYSVKLVYINRIQNTFHAYDLKI